MCSKRIVKSFVLLSLFSLLASTFSCGDDQLDIPNIPLAGKVAGEDWNFKMGFYRYLGSQVEIRLFSEKEAIDDPCAIYTSTNPYIRILIPAAESSPTLPLISPYHFVFDFGNGGSINGDSGFIEIFVSDGFRVQGYIQAVTDDDNTVEGRFELEIC